MAAVGVCKVLQGGPAKTAKTANAAETAKTAKTANTANTGQQGPQVVAAAGAVEARVAAADVLVSRGKTVASNFSSLKAVVEPSEFEEAVRRRQARQASRGIYSGGLRICA